MRSLTRSLAVVPLAMTLALSPSGVAGAGAGDVEVPGRCSGDSRAELKLSDEDGRIEVEFEVDENRVGRRWRVVVRHDGERVPYGPGPRRVHRAGRSRSEPSSPTARAVT